MVALSFLEERPEGKEIINHKDGNPLNNRVDNLEWCTQKENVIHAINNNLRLSMNKYTKEELEQLYLNKRMSLRDIAKIKKVSVNVIQRELKRNGIKVRSLSEADTKYFLTREFLEKELKNKTQSQLANEIGCNQSLISMTLKKFKKEGI